MYDVLYLQSTLLYLLIYTTSTTAVGVMHICDFTVACETTRKSRISLQ